ncbi:TolC family protein, partial [Glaciimonas sp. GG7]
SDSVVLCRVPRTSTNRCLDITQRQYQAGGVSYLHLLDAQRHRKQTELDRIAAQASRYADTVALFQALGGGW